MFYSSAAALAIAIDRSPATIKRTRSQDSKSSAPTLVNYHIFIRTLTQVRSSATAVHSNALKAKAATAAVPYIFAKNLFLIRFGEF
jgi:hypothetical protein